MTTANPSSGPALACFDGSDGSRAALRSAAQVLTPGPVVVLTVWQSLTTQLAREGSFATPGFPGEGEVDEQQRAAAQAAAEEGARSATEQGFQATARVEQSTSAVWETIIEVAKDIDARLIIVGSRGRGVLGRAFVGSTSLGVLHHAHRPVLVAPEPKE